MRTIHLALAALLSLTLLAACQDKPVSYSVLNYWRPIANPNVLMDQSHAQAKLEYDLAQCKCSNYPINVPHHEMAQIVPDQGRMMETAAIKMDNNGACISTPTGVLIECMRQRGWEPTACSGRLETAGGTQCAMSVQPAGDYPRDYPYRGPYDSSFDDSGLSPAEKRQPSP